MIEPVLVFHLRILDDYFSNLLTMETQHFGKILIFIVTIHIIYVAVYYLQSDNFLIEKLLMIHLLTGIILF